MCISSILLLGILRLLFIPAFGEILRPTSAEVSARPPLSSTHYGLQRPCSAKEGNRSAAAGKSACGLVTRLAGVIRLLYAGRAVKEEPQAAGAADKGIRYARQSRRKPPLTRPDFCLQIIRLLMSKS